MTWRGWTLVAAIAANGCGKNRPVEFDETITTEVIEPVGHGWLHVAVVDRETKHGVNLHIHVGASDTVQLGVRALPRLGITIGGDMVGMGNTTYLFLTGPTFEPDGQTVSFVKTTDTRSSASMTDASAQAIDVMAANILPRLDPLKLLRRDAGSGGRAP